MYLSQIAPLKLDLGVRQSGPRELHPTSTQTTETGRARGPYTPQVFTSVTYSTSRATHWLLCRGEGLHFTVSENM